MERNDSDGLLCETRSVACSLRVFSSLLLVDRGVGVKR